MAHLKADKCKLGNQEIRVKYADQFKTIKLLDEEK